MWGLVVSESRVLRVDEALHAEPVADVRCDASDCHHELMITHHTPRSRIPAEIVGWIRRGEAQIWAINDKGERLLST
jgi:hypothetical protein